LAYAGLTKAEVLNEVSLAVQGRPVGTYRGGVEEHRIRLLSDVKTLEEVRSLQIRSGLTGQKVTLAGLGKVRLTAVEPTIKRYNGKRVMTLSSDVLAGHSRREIRGRLIDYLERTDTSGVRFELDGEDEKIAKYFGNLGLSALFALGAIYTILFFEFRSLRIPLLILLTVPLASAGSVFGLFLIDQPLSFTALLGIVSLIGIVVNNAIVLIDHIVYHRGVGLSVDAACREASSKRFRPIILSTTTTIIGLLPLAFSSSELFKPMATALIFGLAISTLLTLVFVPLVYSLVFSEEKVESPVTDGSVEGM
jgi:multidrug efflux pump subunit AcrB